MSGRPGWWPPASARSRIRNAAQVLGQILDAAVAVAGLHRNPAQGLRRPRIIEREMTFLSGRRCGASQIAEPYGCWVRLGWGRACGSGRRAALRVGRLDLLARRVEVVEAATEVNGRLAWGLTKTGERRTVPAPPLPGRPAWRPYLSDLPTPADLVFTMPGAGRSGLQVGRAVLPSGGSGPGCPKASASMTLEHAASLAIRENASVKESSSRCWDTGGHPDARPRGHLSPSDLDALAERLDRRTPPAAATKVWPQGGPAVVQLRKRPGQ